MKLSHRPATLHDFEAFFAAMHSTDPELYDILDHEWKVFLAYGEGLSMVVEALDREPAERFVGFAQTVFVTDSFVERVIGGLPPHINVAASNAMPDGSWPLLGPDQIRAENSGNGLNALTPRWIWRGGIKDVEETRQVRAYMERMYPLYYTGYRFKYVLVPACGEWPLVGLLRNGFSLLTDYSDYHRDNPPLPDSDHRFFLVHARKSVEGAREGTAVCRTFDYTPPHLGFRPVEQELLACALLGLTDSECAKRISVSAAAIKKRWDSIYSRVEQSDPALLPTGGDGTRGAEKRRHLISYLRDHMEEVRPHIANAS